MTERNDEDEYDRALSAWLFGESRTDGRTATVNSFLAFIRRDFPGAGLRVQHMATLHTIAPENLRSLPTEIVKKLIFRGTAIGEVAFKVAAGVEAEDRRFDRAAAGLAAALAWPTVQDLIVGEAAAELDVLEHELRAPLQVFLTSADLLRRDANERTRPLADRITEAVGHARAILETIRPRRATKPPAIGNPSTALSVILEDIGRWRADDPAARIEATIRVQEDATVKVTPFRVRQVLINLLKNANEAITLSGIGSRIDVVVERAKIPEIGGRAVISVIDDGPGIPKDIRERIFERGFTTKAAGRGIGLAVVKTIIDESGGGIRVDSVDPHGTCFRIEWPLLDEGDAQALDATPDTAAVEQAGDGANAASPKAPVHPAIGAKGVRILAIDDDPGMLRTYRMILDLDGHETVGVATAAEGLAKLANERFDAILVDVRLKEMRGGEFFAALKKKHPSLVPRVIFATGDIQNEETRRFLNATGNPYLIKPFEISDLLRAITIAVRKTDR